MSTTVSNRRPSPAMVLAGVALLVALGGTGYAATRRAGHADRRQDRKLILRMAPKLAVRRAAFADAAGRASTAASADTAANADALDGQRMRSFSASFVTSESHQLLDFGGIALQAICTGGNVGLEVVNRSGQSAALQAGWIRESGTAASAQDGNLADGGSDVISSIPGPGSGTAAVSFADGSVTTLIYAYHTAAQAGSGCHVFGRAFAG